MTRRRLLWFVLLVVVAAGLAGWRFRTGHVPAGQPALATLDPASLEAFRADFNRDVDRARLVVLLSPT